MTVADGNCAFDTTRFWKGVHPNAVHRKVMRSDVVESMRDACRNKRWQQAFVDMGEGTPDEHEARVDGDERGASSERDVPTHKSFALAASEGQSLALAASNKTGDPPLPPPAEPPNAIDDFHVVGAACGSSGEERQVLVKALLHHANLKSLNLWEAERVMEKLPAESQEYLLRTYDQCNEP